VIREYAQGERFDRDEVLDAIQAYGQVAKAEQINALFSFLVEVDFHPTAMASIHKFFLQSDEQGVARVVSDFLEWRVNIKKKVSTSLPPEFILMGSDTAGPEFELHQKERVRTAIIDALVEAQLNPDGRVRVLAWELLKQLDAQGAQVFDPHADDHNREAQVKKWRKPRGNK
jgi:hypothetical protein